MSKSLGFKGRGGGVELKNIEVLAKGVDSIDIFFFRTLMISPYFKLRST